MAARSRLDDPVTVAPTTATVLRSSITREEFIELRGQVANIAHSVEQLTSTFGSSLKEREISQRAELARVESETKSRFDKNEEIANSKATADTEGRRWLIGTLAGMIVLVVGAGSWWTSGIKDAVRSDLSNELVTLHEQNATSIKDRQELNVQVLAMERNYSDVKAQIAGMTARYDAKLIEIETQFRADAQARNIQYAQLARTEQMMQSALHESGAKIPAPTPGPYYFPDISQSPR
jgi:hypothetical protein